MARLEELIVDGQEVPYTDATRWRHVSFQNPGTLSIEPVLGQREAYGLDLDLEGKTVALERYQLDDLGQVVKNAAGEAQRAASGRATFSLDRPEEDVLILEGQLDGRPLRARLRKMLLLRRAFHWLFDPGPDSE